MRHYEIIIHNGHYPLSYKCSSIADAYGCLEEANQNLLSRKIDLNEALVSLGDLVREEWSCYQSFGWSVYVREGEI